MDKMSQEKKQFKNPIWGLGSFQALAMFRRGLFYTYLSIYLKDFLGLSVTVTTLYATIPMILSVIGQNFIWGPLSDKIQNRRMFIIVGELLAGILLFIVWWEHTLPDSKLVAGYIIIGGLTLIELFWSMSNIGWSALISDLYPSKKRSEVMGWLNSIGGVGRIIGATAGGLLYDLRGYRFEGWGFDQGWLFIVASLVMFLSAIPMFFTAEGGRNIIHEKPEEKITFEKDNPSLSLDPRLVKKIFMVFLISLVFINFGRNSIATIQSQYLTLDSGFDVDSLTLSYIANARSVSVIIFGLITGWICKKIGEDNALLLGSFIAIASLFIYSLPVGIISMYGANVGLGISELMVFAASYTYASKLIPYEKRARLFAAYNATFFLSWGLSGTVLIGPIVDLLLNSGFGEVFSYRMSFLAAAGMTLFGFFIFFGLVIYTRKKKIRNEMKNLF